MATPIDIQIGLELMQKGTPVGYSRIIASGTFLGAWELPDGQILERYLQYGWKDKFLLTEKSNQTGFDLKNSQSSLGLS